MVEVLTLVPAVNLEVRIQPVKVHLNSLEVEVLLRVLLVGGVVVSCYEAGRMTVSKLGLGE